MSLPQRGPVSAAVALATTTRFAAVRSTASGWFEPTTPPTTGELNAVLDDPPPPPDSPWFVGDVEHDPMAAVAAAADRALAWFTPSTPAAAERPGGPPSCALLGEASEILRATGRHVVADWVDDWARAVAPIPAGAAR